jgi:glyoxylase-like metal-dependent hydrolase (beta-lactamase superfamily II)
MSEAKSGDGVAAGSTAPGFRRGFARLIRATKVKTMPAQTRKIGDIEVTPLSDGVLTTSLDVVLGLQKEELERLSGKKAGDPVPIAVNAFLLKLRDKLVLVDAGSGNTMGPTLGKLPGNLWALGVTPDKIDVIVLTHLHPDHSNGLVDDDGRAIYPNAEIVLHANEAGFWLDRDPSTGASERISRNIAKSAVTTKPYRARMRTVREGEVLPGISALPLPGHTPGHTGWLIESGKDALLIWGDLVHLAAVQVARPDTGLVFDVDPQAACATRRRMFDRVAADRLKVAGAHLDFPGFGTIVRKGAEFRFETDV